MKLKNIILSLFLAFTFSTTQAQLNVGDIAPEIKLPDSLGKWKPLSEVKAKIILLDFWAAWCYPCVQSMPDLISIYENYHKKGLEVYAVSLDKDYYNWVAMCRKLNLPFVLVNDAYGMNGKTCKQYHIESIPNKLLIKDGKIFAINKSLYDINKILEKELESEN
ncbi:MAG: TlpA family protein disulfide reductase [Chitinophagaceae bacterium]|nr:MAG: thioredoxin [Bacteroidetes bacterium OLB11]MCC6448626.1 TlpA family protein disulfide reductase [Chitinophagaceae bacterium]HMN32286.1 TlpA disulfide reductase family protein [Chitinophagaceae bacterium]